MGLDKMPYQMGGNLLSCKSFQMGNQKLRSSANIRIILVCLQYNCKKKEIKILGHSVCQPFYLL